MKAHLFLASLIALSSCSKELRPVHVEEDLVTPVLSSDVREVLPRLAGYRVEEFTLTVFHEGMSRSQWKDVFLLTGELARLRGDILNARGRTLPSEEQEANDQKILRASELLISLYENHAAYLLSWGDAENCQVSQDLRLQCAPLYDVYGENPLNGGNPRVEGVLQPLRFDRDKAESLSFELKNQVPDYGEFRIRTYLKPEPTRTGYYFKGDVVIEGASGFLKSGVPAPHFRFGYAELRLVPDAGS